MHLTLLSASLSLVLFIVMCSQNLDPLRVVAFCTVTCIEHKDQDQSHLLLSNTLPLILRLPACAGIYTSFLLLALSLYLFLRCKAQDVLCGASCCEHFSHYHYERTTIGRKECLFVTADVRYDERLKWVMTKADLKPSVLAYFAEKVHQLPLWNG